MSSARRVDDTDLSNTLNPDSEGAKMLSAFETIMHLLRDSTLNYSKLINLISNDPYAFITPQEMLAPNGQSVATVVVDTKGIQAVTTALERLATVARSLYDEVDPRSRQSLEIARGRLELSQRIAGEGLEDDRAVVQITGIDDSLLGVSGDDE